MSGVVLFPASPDTFCPRIEVVAAHNREAGRELYAVAVFDHNGRHILDRFDELAPAKACVDTFRAKHPEVREGGRK